MPDPIERKRLRKKMLDRWENEGGRIGTDTIDEDASRPTNEDKSHRRKPFTPSNNSPESPKKRRKTAQNERR